MLSAEERFTLPGLDNIALFPDTTLTGGFYAVSTVPRVVVGEDGQPNISLTVYGRRTAGAFTANGGILTITTELAVSDDDQARVRRALAARLAEGWTDPKSEPPQPQLLAVDWLEASATVQLTAELLLTGKPSMTSTNQCSFSTKLTDSGASALARAWKDGLSGATITYTGRLRAGRAGGGTSTSTDSRTSTSSTVSSSTSSSSHTSSSHTSTSWSSDSSGGSSGSSGSSEWSEADEGLRRTDEEQPGNEPLVTRTSSFECSIEGESEPRPDPASDPASDPAPDQPPTIAVGEPHPRVVDGDLITGSARLADSVPHLAAHLLFVEL